MLASKSKSGFGSSLMGVLLLCGGVSGCASLNDKIGAFSGSLSGDISASKKVSIPADFPAGERAYTEAERAVQQDGWAFLTRQSVAEAGVCAALAQSSPIKEYWEIDDCNAYDDGSLAWLRGDRKGTYASIVDDCASGIPSCGFVAKALRNEDVSEYRRFFQGTVLMHDPALIDALVTTHPYNTYYGGGFFDDHQFAFFDGIEGLGIVGDPADSIYLDALVDEPWKLELMGRDMRNKLALSYWWVGTADSAPMLAKLLSKEHATAYPDREFRSTVLGALSLWRSDAGVDFCKYTFRDLGSEDRAACMLYLVQRGHAEDANIMVRYVEESGESALFALGMTKSPEAKAYLTELVDNDGYLEPVIALALTGESSAKKQIAAMANDPSWSNRRIANALGYFSGTPDAQWAISLLKPIASELKKNDDMSVYATFVAAQAQLGDMSVIPTLIKLLNDPDEDVRSTVVDEIGGKWGVTNSPTPNFRIVANQQLLDALDEAFEAESDSSEREDISRAALNIRSALRAAAL